MSAVLGCVVSLYLWAAVCVNDVTSHDAHLVYDTTTSSHSAAAAVTSTSWLDWRLLSVDIDRQEADSLRARGVLMTPPDDPTTSKPDPRQRPSSVETLYQCWRPDEVVASRRAGGRQCQSAALHILTVNDLWVAAAAAGLCLLPLMGLMTSSLVYPCSMAYPPLESLCVSVSSIYNAIKFVLCT